MRNIILTVTLLILFQSGNAQNSFSAHNVISYADMNFSWTCGQMFMTVNKTKGKSILLNHKNEDTKPIASPNPAENYVDVNLTRIPNSNFIVEFWDIHGRLLEVSQYRSGESPVRIQLNGYPKGLYFVILKSETQSTFKPIKIIKH